MLPSPTAAATRLTGLKRTSPHAKMPGTLVSSKYGSRSSFQPPAAPLVTLSPMERNTLPVRDIPLHGSSFPTSGFASLLGSRDADSVHLRGRHRPLPAPP